MTSTSSWIPYTSSTESDATIFAILDAIPVPEVLIRYEDHKIVYLNSAAEELFRQPRENFEGKTCHNLICPRDKGNCPAPDKTSNANCFECQSLIQGKPETTFKCMKPLLIDGTKFILETVHPQANPGPLSFHNEIMTALRESRSRYNSLFTQNHTPMLIIDPDSGRIADANLAAQTFYGYSKKRLTDLNISDINQLSPDEIFMEMERARRQERNHFLFPHRLASGKVRTIEVYSGPIQLEGKQLLYSLIHDVTDRMTTESQLEERTSQLKQLFSKSPIAMVQRDPAGNVLEINEAFTQLFGYTQEELFGKHVEPFLLGVSGADPHPTLFPEEEALFRPVQIETARLRKGNKPVEVIFIGFPILYEAHDMGSYCLYQDISARKEAEREVIETNLNLEEQNSVLKTTWDKTIGVLAYAAEVRDPYTASHQKRVAFLARAIAEELGLSRKIVDETERAGLVHDLGKFEIPSEILSKPGRISEIEFNIIKRHARTGYDILKQIELPWPLAEVVYQHHERLDGSGYPRGLKGKQILQEARIIAVADMVEAMSSHRPYRPALGTGQALEQIEKEAGNKLDADAVKACCRLFREKRFTFNE